MTTVSRAETKKPPQRSAASDPAVTLITSFFAMAAWYAPRAHGPAAMTRRARRPTKLGSGCAARPAHRGAPVLEAFFEALLALVCVAVLAFIWLAVSKLYEGQR